MITKEKILSCVSCEEIFFNDVGKTKELYRKLVKLYHPDISKDIDANNVFQKITQFYNEALEKLEKEIWYEKDVVFLVSSVGKKYKLKYLKCFDFELGTCYVGRSHIIFIFTSGNKKYFDNALARQKDFKFLNENMKKEFTRILPNIVETFTTDTGCFAIVCKKDVLSFSLEDIHSKFKSSLDSRHIAWIISRLLNICCFLEYNHIVHNGLSLSNCYISPSEHLLYLQGGWWYSVGQGEKMIGVSKKVYDLMPIKTKSSKVASSDTDLECVRYIGRELSKNIDIPTPLKIWLEQGTTKDALSEFKEWDKVLLSCWGERKFIVWEVSEKEIYI